MSENAISDVQRVADTIIHPFAVIAKGETLAHHGGGEADDEREDFDQKGRQAKGFASSMVPTLEEKTILGRRPSATHANGKPVFDVIEEGEHSESPAEAQVPGSTKEQATIVDNDEELEGRGIPKIQGDPQDKEMYGAPANAYEDDDRPPTKGTKRSGGHPHEAGAIAARKVLRKHLSAKVGISPWTMPTPTPKINPNRFHDPLDDRFWKDMWVAVAVHNTEIYRKVFRCVPDDLVTSWASYKAFGNHAEKFNKTPEGVTPPRGEEPVKVVHDGLGTHGARGGGSGGGAIGQGGEGRGSEIRGPDAGDTGGGNSKPGSPTPAVMGKSPGSESTSTFSSDKGRKPSGPEEAWHEWEREEMEEVLGEIRGHLGESSPSMFARKQIDEIWCDSDLLYEVPRVGGSGEQLPL